MSGAIAIRFDPEVDPRAICGLRESVGWDRLEADYPAALRGYWGTVGAFDARNRLVGWCAILSDGVRHGVLIDVIVHPRVQRQGVGRRIVAAAVEALESDGIVIIHVDFRGEIAPFYERCGFRIGLGGIYEGSAHAGPGDGRTAPETTQGGDG